MKEQATYGQNTKAALREIGAVSLFAGRFFREVWHPPFEIKEFIHQCYVIGYKSLVLVDDVLNSGTTLMYAVKHFLEVPLKEFKTAVLVNRNHKKYPIKADFKGLSLSTSLQEHITVEFNNNESRAFLN